MFSKYINQEDKMRTAVISSKTSILSIRKRDSKKLAIVYKSWEFYIIKSTLDYKSWEFYQIKST